MTIAEAIRRLESMATELTGACVEAQSDKVSAYIARKIEAVDMAIVALKEQDVTDINVGNKWISVKDRLPEPIDDVLVYHEDGTIEIEWLYHAGDFAYEGIYGNVTHWMPLPTPPKEYISQDIKTEKYTSKDIGEE